MPFANSILFGGAAPTPALLWLAGLLEAEGTFLRPAPSNPACPIVSCRMTDRDVIDRVAVAFGTSALAIDKGRYKTEYAVTVRGSRAVALMIDIRTVMGARRQKAISRALDGYSPPMRKLDYEKAEAIRARCAAGETISSIARSFGIARQTIHQIRDYRIYKKPKEFPWRTQAFRLGGITAAGTGLTWAELYWLAGWLEGEGSFVRPPPSSPRGPRIVGQCRDIDVIEEVGRLVKVKPVRSGGQRAKEKGWSQCWRITRAGGRAVTIMQSIRGIMGQRRQEQIDAAIQAAHAAGAVLGWHERRHGPNQDWLLSDEQIMEAARIERACSSPKLSASTGIAGA